MDQNIQKLKDAGLKITPQRIAIMEFFEGNKSHPSINTIYENLKVNYPSISVSTIYNTVETLVKNNYLLELPIAKGKSFYDPDVSEHDHAYCVKCGRVYDIDPEKEKQAAPESLRGCEIVEVRKTYYIVCGDCRKTF
ncbi:MAG TPA: Fur family transcriptional regulator [Spirochaetota bacterium]|nr:Fur family transcriptional regulator [Spirochaetota bacterium]HPS86173.1 Fur family transcriptional regulator [Spirochaetota bacterium]